VGFERGLTALDKNINQQQQGGSQFGPRLGYISWKDGDKKILRFLTNEIIVGEFAEWVQTNDPKRTADFLIDPDGPNYVERYGGLSREFGTGNLVSPKLRKMGVAVAVVREERPAGNGRLEVVDYNTQIEVDDKHFSGRQYGVIKQSLRFWQQFQGMVNRYGTLCDRDYEVIRRGSDKNTRYDIAPIDPVDDLRDLEVLQARYGYGRKFDDKDPDRFLYCPQTLEAWADYYSSEERAKFWLAPKNGAPFVENGDMATSSQVTLTVPSSGLGEFKQETSSNPSTWGVGGQEDEAQAAPSSNSSFADLKSSLLPHLNK
jgi:hypothetical protein